MTETETTTPSRKARTERTVEARDNTSARPAPLSDWTPPSLLPKPNYDETYIFRWVRVAMNGAEDRKNVSQRFREGWEPVRAEDHPELNVLPDIDSRWEGNIEVGGLLLCKAPRKVMQQRNQYYSRMSGEMLRSVDNNLMKENDPRMPISTPYRKSTSSFTTPV